MIRINAWRVGQAMCWIGVGSEHDRLAKVCCLVLALGLVISEEAFARMKVVG